MKEIIAAIKDKDLLICKLQTYLDRAEKILVFIEEDSNPCHLKKEATKYFKDKEKGV